ncbi:hypothetical protein C2R22_06035 [Salinigranum rubrum]|uniref:Uncharacterized protein n=1 Tax=Salinigranum rubrum TaxID=755307 RepID=A0A2I8VH75_9EURY|nr:hypothetical protein [Salinigranum rubrum]AUV81278.1 hypothetical protein C2R22_06035 [Salinigranum rubrum]
MPRPRIHSDRFRCPGCGNRNECRMCVLSRDADEPAPERRMHCADCSLTAPASEFAAPALSVSTAVDGAWSPTEAP